MRKRPYCSLDRVQPIQKQITPSVSSNGSDLFRIFERHQSSLQLNENENTAFDSDLKVRLQNFVSGNELQLTEISFPILEGQRNLLERYSTYLSPHLFTRYHHHTMNASNFGKAVKFSQEN